MSSDLMSPDLVMKHVDDPNLTPFLFETLFPMVEDLLDTKTGLEALETLLYYISKTSDRLNKDLSFPRISLSISCAKSLKTSWEGWI